MLQGNAQPRTNGLRAHARTQRNPPPGLVLGTVSRAISKVKSHVAHKSQDIGERDTDSKVQDQSRATGALSENPSRGPQGIVQLGHSLPRSTPQHAQDTSQGIDARSERGACLVEHTTGNYHVGTVGLPSMHGLWTQIRDEQSVLWKMRRQASIPHVFSSTCGTNQDTLALSPSKVSPPFFLVTQAGCDDGFSSQPERVTTEESPDTGETGDAYNAEIEEWERVDGLENLNTTAKPLPGKADTEPLRQRGVIDHVSKETSVAYDFAWTRKPKDCEFCGRAVHIQVIIHGRKHRICRKDLKWYSFPAWVAFIVWVKDQW